MLNPARDKTSQAGMSRRRGSSLPTLCDPGRVSSYSWWRIGVRGADDSKQKTKGKIYIFYNGVDFYV